MRGTNYLQNEIQRQAIDGTSTRDVNLTEPETLSEAGRNASHAAAHDEPGSGTCLPRRKVNPAHAWRSIYATACELFGADAGMGSPAVMHELCDRAMMICGFDMDQVYAAQVLTAVRDEELTAA